MNAWQKKFYDDWSSLRDRALRPLAKILDFLGVSPNALTLSGIISMFFFVFLVKDNTKLALILVAFTIFSDMLDGVLARYQKIASPRGKLIDISADALNFCLFILALGRIGLARQIAFALIFSSIISRILRVFYQYKYQNSPQVFYPVVGFLPNFLGMTAYGLATLDILSNYGIINSQIWTLMAIILIFDSMFSSHKILKR